jgi:hypothetical protein
MKHADKQTGGFGHSDSAAQQQAMVAKRTVHAAPTQNTSGRSGRSILQQISEKVEQKAKNVRVVFVSEQ